MSTLPYRVFAQINFFVSHFFGSTLKLRAGVLCGVFHEIKQSKFPGVPETSCLGSLSSGFGRRRVRPYLFKPRTVSAAMTTEKTVLKRKPNKSYGDFICVKDVTALCIFQSGPNVGGPLPSSYVLGLVLPLQDEAKHNAHVLSEKHCIILSSYSFLMEEAKEIVEKAVLNGETSLELSSLELDILPFEFFSETLVYVTVLNLDYNDFQVLPAEISRLSALRVLSATGNQLKELPETIKELENLQCLHLNENCLRELPLFLSKLPNLEVVDATGNGIDSWKKGFGEQLLELRLDENRLSTLPESLSCMKNLKVLDLGDNNLTSLPDDIGSLTKLEILNLSQNNITELPASVGDLPSLKILDLSGNHFEDLPESFQSAGVIESFFMEKNYVKTLPSWYGSLCNIVNLGMADNQLVGNPLPDNFGSVSGKSLRTLDLSGNNISQLPDSVGELKHLEKLQLGSTICELERRAFQNGNWLHSLPNSFGWMINLQKLHLDENLLTELPENFGSLVNLEWADFGQNRLQRLPESFCSLTRLWFLQLSQNFLERLPDDFGNLTNLVELRLSNNYLAELPSSFANLTNLQTLDLFHNELTKIPKQLLNLKKLLRLDLDKNKFKLKAEKVPKLTKQVKYPSRDPNRKNNWRGKTREDYIEPDEEKTVQMLNEVDEDEEDYQDDDTDEEEITYSEAALEFAMKRSLSIWKSHEGRNPCS